MARNDILPSFVPDPASSGIKSTEGEDAVFVWFSPVDAPSLRFKYAVIKEENAVVSIQPGEGRFKKGLKALRWESEKATESSLWLVLKTKPNRIDLKLVK